jgi:hypothetical protein
VTADLDGFDCVTYVESVLALARSSNTTDFRRNLRQIRYRAGRVSWSDRNHYMTDWARRNVARGALRSLTRGAGTILRGRRLETVPGLPRRNVQVRCFPKRSYGRIAKRLATGDVVLFVSTKPNLDVFHMGLVVQGPRGPRLRHAARSRGRVVEQRLADFMAAQRMSGFVVLRPLEGR